MEETFLCFESDRALFLVPLGLVSRIVPGRARADGRASDEESGIPVMAAGALWGSGDDGCGDYTVLLQEGGRLRGLSVSNVLGVYPVDPLTEKEIPPEARGEQNAWLKRAVYLKDLDRWAFILDERIVSEIKGL